MTKPLDLQWVRDQFELAADLAFFDNAGGTFPLRSVVARVAEYLRRWPAQLGASHRVSVEAGAAQKSSLQALAKLLNADAGELVAGPSSSALTDRVARALKGQLQAGDNLVVTVLDHEANISPWLRLQRAGVEVRFWHPANPAGQPDLDSLRQLMDSRTRILACTHASNILGGILPMSDIRQLTRERGVQLFVDGVALAPHRRVDVTALDADYYVMSLYKLFGPHIGLLHGKASRLQALDNINLEHLPQTAVPYKLQPGGACYELLYGAAAIPEYLAALGARCGESKDPLAVAFSAIASHEQVLGEQFLEGLLSLPGVRVHGPATADALQRLPIYSFTIDGQRAESVCHWLDQRDIAVRHGHFHSRRLLGALLPETDPEQGVIRVSMAHYNSTEEVSRLLEGLAELPAAQ